MDIILFLIVLGVNVLIHEFAHFYFARKADILCHEFSIGMGPAIYQKKKGETLYSIRAIPLGGYVSMAGEELNDFVKKDKNLGIKLNEDGLVEKIILNNESNYDFIGKVVDFDLDGENMKPLFIKMIVSGEEKEFEVSRVAHYVLDKNKEIQVGPSERSYENKTLMQRFLTVIAGPVSNFIIALLLLFILGFFIGKPIKTPVVGEVSSHLAGIIEKDDVIKAVNGDNVESYQDLTKALKNAKSDKVTLTISTNGQERIETISLAIIFQGLDFIKTYDEDDVKVSVVGDKTSLEIGDQIIGIYFSNKKNDNNIVYELIANWEDLLSLVDSHKNKEYVYYKVLREGEEKELSSTVLQDWVLQKLNSDSTIYQIGIAQKSKFNILYPLYYPFVQIGTDMKVMFNTIGLLFSTKSNVGVKDLAGPVGIFQMVSNAKKAGASAFIIFVAFLSVNIGVLNLLPIPALDGGRIVFIIYEAITKRKVNKKVENTLILITFILLLTLMVFVTYQDILRLFRK